MKDNVLNDSEYKIYQRQRAFIENMQAAKIATPRPRAILIRIIIAVRTLKQTDSHNHRSQNLKQKILAQS